MHGWKRWGFTCTLSAEGRINKALAAHACNSSFIIAAFSRIVVHISRPPSDSKNLAVAAYFSHTSLVMKGGSMTCGTGHRSCASAWQTADLRTDHHVESLRTICELPIDSEERGKAGTRGMRAARTWWRDGSRPRGSLKS